LRIFEAKHAHDPDIGTCRPARSTKREQISDWGYVLNGKQIGSYTVCVLFKTMPEKDVARYKRDHGFSCEG